MKNGNDPMSVRHLAVVGMALCLTLLAAPLIVSAQTPAITGFLSNFDVPNNVKDAQGNSRETEGFEIELDGIQPCRVALCVRRSGGLGTLLDPSAAPPAACYIRYCQANSHRFSDPQHPPFGIYVRWTVAGWDTVAQKFTSNFNIPGTILTSAGTPPVAAGTFFTGHPVLEPGTGCELSTSRGASSLASRLRKRRYATTYRWIVGNASIGALTYADGTALPTASSPPPSSAVSSVPIMAPAAQIVAGQVEAVIQAPAPAPPAPAALAHRYGLAQWVKVYRRK